MQGSLVRLLVVASVLSLAVPAASSAIDFSLFGSWWDTDEADSSLGLGARLAFLKRIQIELGAGYFKDLELRGERPDGEPSALRLDVEAIPVDLGLRIPVGQSGFFIGGGGTLVFLDGDRVDFDDEFGYYLAAGLQGNHWFLEVQWRDIEGTVSGIDDLGNLGDVEFIEGEPTVNVAGLQVNLGYRF